MPLDPTHRFHFPSCQLSSSMAGFQEPLYKSPLEGFEAAASATSGGDVASPTSQRLSQVYETFTAPVDTGPDGGFDVHVYYFQDNAAQKKYAQELWERIKREFPELKIGDFWDWPAGPHSVATFEVDLLTSMQFGALSHG
ncbi:hypothetical protein LMH87_004069 [Akanthomyces muscarius]|uniref:Uncharacterized protein n=1 Tax=Akanthomyces muscarius TaxID=2231603 RepID=A0A9W8UHQ3_AKAMU|nr:hypothetical protein LMH87_004069 [Akanthomyces muscarius]KAJ4145214.1 hypothetical protein LMH87_004069 [Akanthomyces muscarius]